MYNEFHVPYTPWKHPDEDIEDYMVVANTGPEPFVLKLVGTKSINMMHLTRLPITLKGPSNYDEWAYYLDETFTHLRRDLGSMILHIFEGRLTPFEMDPALASYYKVAFDWRLKAIVFRVEKIMKDLMLLSIDCKSIHLTPHPHLRFFELKQLVHARCKSRQARKITEIHSYRDRVLRLKNPYDEVLHHQIYGYDWKVPFLARHLVTRKFSYEDLRSLLFKIEMANLDESYQKAGQAGDHLIKRRHSPEQLLVIDSLSMVCREFKGESASKKRRNRRKKKNIELSTQK